MISNSFGWFYMLVYLLCGLPMGLTRSGAIVFSLVTTSPIEHDKPDFTSSKIVKWTVMKSSLANSRG